MVSSGSSSTSWSVSGFVTESETEGADSVFVVESGFVSASRSDETLDSSEAAPESVVVI